MEYLEVQVKIPTILIISVKTEIYETITSLPCQELRVSIITDDIYIYYFNIPNINLALHIEELFDKYINLKVQYNYLLYEVIYGYTTLLMVKKRI